MLYSGVRNIYSKPNSQPTGDDRKLLFDTLVFTIIVYKGRYAHYHYPEPVQAGAARGPVLDRVMALPQESSESESAIALQLLGIRLEPGPRFLFTLFPKSGFRFSHALFPATAGRLYPEAA